MITIELVDDIHCRFRNILKINNVITVTDASDWSWSYEILSTFDTWHSSHWKSRIISSERKSHLEEDAVERKTVNQLESPNGLKVEGLNPGHLEALSLTTVSMLII